MKKLCALCSVAVSAPLFLIAALVSRPGVAAIVPLQADGSTLHLWHLDETGVPCLDSVPGGTNLAALAGGATLGNTSISGFGTCLSTLDGGQSAFGGANSDAVLTTLGVNTPAAVQYCDPTTGAFTFEAVVHIEFDPAKNFGPVGGGGNGRNTPFQIVNADGNSTSQRIFQFRIDPIGFQAFSGDTSANVIRLEFINLNGTQNILTPLPVSGPDAIVSNNWYHVAVTYSGTANTAGNINFYWTLLDTNRSAASLLDSSKNMLNSLSGSATPSVFTIGNAGRNPSGSSSNPLNANFLGRIDEVRISNVARSPANMVFGSTNILIVSQPTPANQVVGSGQPFGVNVAATSAAPLGYQWRLNGKLILGATNTTFGVASAQISDSGNYDVIVANSFTTVTSIVAAVTVTDLAIVTQPSSIAAGYAGMATFSVGAAGTQPLSYQWWKEGNPIAGATNSSLTLVVLSAADAGDYYVVVSNNLKVVISDQAVLTVGGPPLSLTSINDGNPPASGYGYAGSSDINATAFICSGLTTVGNQQFLAYYGRHQTDATYPYNNTVWIARRTIGSNSWEVFRTSFTANDITDGHDVVVFGIDGGGYMHLTWGMHNATLHYARSTGPVTGSDPISFGADLGTMTGTETSVTYPQFLAMPNGDLLFIYRVGASGGGDTWLNRWSLAAQTWSNVNFSNGVPIQFIKGLWSSANYNAYPQMPCLDDVGDLFFVWTWRETPAYESNHDLNFAKSPDGGVTWQQFDGTPYDLPISKSGENGDPNTIAQIIMSIPQNSSLINQAGMTLDASNNPVIATWWAPGSSGGNYRRQYMVVFPDSNGVWQARQIFNRTNDPAGTMMLDSAVRDLGRPVVVCDQQNRLIVIYRDNFGSNGLTVAYSLPYAVDPQRTNWTTMDLTTDNLGNYEPVIDLPRWKKDGVLDIVYQASSGEGYNPPANNASPIGVLEWNAASFFNHHPLLQFALTNSNRDALLSWNSQPGWGYQLQQSTNLTDWSTVTTLSGISGYLPVQYVHTNATAGPHKFWRLRTQQGGF
jgi:hypothetical protein